MRFWLAAAQVSTRVMTAQAAARLQSLRQHQGHFQGLCALTSLLALFAPHRVVWQPTAAHACSKMRDAGADELQDALLSPVMCILLLGLGCSRDSTARRLRMSCMCAS